MTLPDGYLVTIRGNLAILTRQGQVVYEVPNKGRAREGLEEVAYWHHRERSALVASWKSPLGSDRKEEQEAMRKTAETKMLTAMRACMGARQWS